MGRRGAQRSGSRVGLPGVVSEFGCSVVFLGSVWLCWVCDWSLLSGCVAGWGCVMVCWVSFAGWLVGGFAGWVVSLLGLGRE